MMRKGLVIEKKFCEQVFLKWNMVLRRIETLIQKNQYLPKKAESEEISDQNEPPQEVEIADQESVPNFGTEATISSDNSHIRVAIESSEDVEERK